MDTQLFESEKLTDLDAEILCSGCPVIPECALDATKKIDVTAIARNVLGVELDGGKDEVPQSGWVRGGIRM